MTKTVQRPVMELPVIMAAGYDGIWHITLATYPAEMETACGKRMRAVIFGTKDHPSHHQRPACEECLKVTRG